MRIIFHTPNNQKYDLGSFEQKNGKITIQYLKEQMFDRTGIDPKLFILKYDGKKMNNNFNVWGINKSPMEPLVLIMMLKQKIPTVKIVEELDKLQTPLQKKNMIDMLYSDSKSITNDQKKLLNAKYQKNFSGKFTNNLAVSFIQGYEPYKSNQSYGISELINAGLINAKQQDEIKRKLSLSTNSSSSSARLNNIAPLKKKLSINEAVHIIKNSKVPLNDIQKLIKNGTINEKNYANIMNRINKLDENGLKK